VSSPGKQTRGGTTALDVVDRAPGLRVLYVLASLKYLRYFQATLELLVERGHSLRLLLVEAPAEAREREWVARMRRHPNFAADQLDHFADDRYHKRGVRLRRTIDYVRLLDAVYDRGQLYRRRKAAWRAAQWIHAAPLSPLLRTRRGRRLLVALLELVDRAVPPPPRVGRYLDEVGPDVLVVGDHGRPGSRLSSYVVAAQARGIPVAVAVATWDYLTTRQRTPTVPDALIVWNRRQLEEAVSLHGIPPERVALTGAPGFDDWFGWQPREAGVFRRRVGLPPDRSHLLWVGGALRPSSSTEAEYAGEWLEALRASEHASLRTMPVLLRPHPRRIEQWKAVDFSRFADTVVWPTDTRAMPIAREQKADFFDSIYHSAVVVGLNSSAMIEAAIVGRPVLAILVPRFFDSQLGTFHFPYLVEANGGPVATAESLSEHFDQLAAAVAGNDPIAGEHVRRFVTDFVRPHGLEQSAAAHAVAAVEQLARNPVRPSRESAWLPLLRHAFLAAAHLVRTTRRHHRTVAAALRR
jgi:hypothetical protein